ncbi:hypothetical protein [Microbispora sp. NPDC049633]|uniref:hypothetical protein n=1 Tax=Microbispora sp. NPDC049633 TaxID=3154355 RepID=UPI003434705D
MANLFAAGTHRERLREARALIAGRQAEVEKVEAQLAEADDALLKRVLRTRLAALADHINGWQEYINQGCPRDPRAQITRGYYSRRNLATH